jgi:hypothetical protein
MRLRIVEFADELGHYKYIENENIIALNICAQSFFKKKNIKFENSLNFFGEEGHTTVLRESKKIIEILKNYFEFTDKNNLKASYTEGFNNYLLFYLRYILILIFIIDKAITKYKPTKIIVPNSTLIKDFDYYCSPKDRLLGYLVKKYVKEKKLKIEIIEEKQNKKKNKLNLFFLKKFFKKIVYIFLYFIFKFFFKKNNFYIINDDGHNFNNIIKKVKKEYPFMKPLFLSLSNKGIRRYGFDIFRGSAFSFFLNSHLTEANDSSLINQSIDRFSSSLLENNLYNKNVSFLNINLVYEVNTFVTNTMLRALKEFNVHAHQLVKILKISKPKFMIVQHTLLIGRAFGELSYKYNIPALVVSHGSHVSHEQSDIKNEWHDLANTMINKDFPYVAVQSPHMLKYLKDNNYNNEQIITTGPLLYNKIEYSDIEIKQLKKKIFKENHYKKIILHAGTPKMRGSNRLFVYETVDEYIRNINNIIAVLKKRNDVFFAVKYRKNPRISLKDFKELINENEFCKVFHEGDFSDFLAVSDIMVSYSSTTIDEALYNRIPIILYDPDNKYSHIKALKINKDDKDLKDGIFYCSKLENFSFTVDKIFNNKEKLKKNDLLWDKYILNTSNEKNWLSHLI